MNVFAIYAIFFFVMRISAVAQFVWTGDEPPPSVPHPAIFTPLDEALFSGFPFASYGKVVPRYMADHSLGAEQMFALLESNIAEHLAKGADSPYRIDAAIQTITPMLYVDGKDEGLRRIAAYAEKRYPESVRQFTISQYLAAAQLDGLPFASNVMTQTWRDYNEHHVVWNQYHLQSLSVSPKERAKYVEFFKWAVLNAHLAGSLKSWDGDIIGMDPSWRTNAFRRVSGEFQIQFALNEISSNNVLVVIRDYEAAAGIRKTEPHRNSASPQTVNGRRTSANNTAPTVANAVGGKTLFPTNAPSSTSSPRLPTFSSISRIVLLSAFATLISLIAFAWLILRPRRKHSSKHK